MTYTSHWKINQFMHSTDQCIPFHWSVVCIKLFLERIWLVGKIDSDDYNDRICLQTWQDSLPFSFCWICTRYRMYCETTKFNNHENSSSKINCTFFVLFWQLHINVSKWRFAELGKRQHFRDNVNVFYIFGVATSFKHRGLQIFLAMFLFPDALLRCRVVVVAKLKNWRLPSSEAACI